MEFGIGNDELWKTAEQQGDVIEESSNDGWNE